MPPGPWCFRHQVLLRCDRHVHDGGSGRPARVSERPHVAQPQDNAPQGHEDVPQLPNASSLALSPDGRTLIYTGPDALYRRDMEQLDVQRLPGTDGATQAVFSPMASGSHCEAQRALRKLSLAGGPSASLAEADVRGASWGPDETIVFGTLAAGLFRVSVAGGDPEPITTLLEGENSHRHPDILPSGEAALFTASTESVDTSQVAVVSLETGERRNLVGGHSPRYASTGHIVFAREASLWAVPFDADRLAITGAVVPVLEGVRARANGTAQFALANNGSLVYIADEGSATRERTLAWVDRQGVRSSLGVPARSYLSPRISPDGLKLAVQSQEDAGNNLWLYDLSEDRAIEQVTFEGDNHRPVWTPDSQRITFSSDRDGTMSLYWMPADGTGVAERLTTAEEGTSHWMGSWRPDGQTLVFNVQRQIATDWDIWLLSLEDRQTEASSTRRTRPISVRNCLPTGGGLRHGAGPNAPSADIYVDPFPLTGSRRKISQSGGLWPLWSPDESSCSTGRRLSPPLHCGPSISQPSRTLPLAMRRRFRWKSSAS